jgi:hypothetical protein
MTRHGMVLCGVLGGLLLSLAMSAEAQLPAVADEYVLVASAEFADGQGVAGPLVTCESLMGRAPLGSQRGRVEVALPGGERLELKLELRNCGRVGITPTCWVVNAEMGATAVLRSEARKHVLRWQASGTYSVPVDGRVLVGAAALSPGAQTSQSVSVYLGLRLLKEPDE